MQVDDLLMNPSYISNVVPVALPDFSGFCYHCEFDSTRFTPEAALRLGIDIPKSLHRAVVKRKAEYVAGRYLAKLCLAELGIDSTVVTISQQRAPKWPEGVMGSISHSNTKAICVIQQQHNSWQGLGIDIEQRLTDTTAQSIKNTITNETEQALIQVYCSDFSEGLTVIFSAKESLFKALYPQVNAYFDFLDAEVTAMVGDAITLTLNKDLTPRLSSGCQFNVQFCVQGTEIMTFLQV